MKSKNILSIIAGGLMLTACSSENVWDYDGSASGSGGEYVDVTFNISPESLAVATRADDNPFEGGPGRWQTLSKGSQIDMLIYAVYDEEFVIMNQYSQGVIDYTKGQMPASFKSDFTVDETGNHVGQTIMYVGDNLYNGTGVTVSLRLMRGKEYNLAFWAQSSKTDAYDTNDLRTVEVKYLKAGNALYSNNDESRDAFCKNENFTVTTGGITQDIILKRPFAQINVGTTGADYKNMEKGKYTFPTRTVTYSKISIDGVAKYLDVVNDKVLTSNDISSATQDSPYYALKQANANATVNVEFDWARVPAYYKMDIPTSDFYLKADEEEMLTIDLNQDGNILDYRTSYPTLGSNGGYMTEEFKYLSMSYVLVPAPVDEENEGAYSYVLSNIVVDFADDAKGGNKLTSFNVSQIPSRRNWRTNIIGGMKWMKDPTDPDDPFEDPDKDPENPDPTTPPDGPDTSTVFNTVYAVPTIVSDFFGDKEIVKVEDYLPGE